MLSVYVLYIIPIDIHIYKTNLIHFIVSVSISLPTLQKYFISMPACIK